MVITQQQKIIAELAILHEISSFELLDSEESIGRNAIEKASRLFGIRYFAWLREEEEGQRVVASWGFRTPADVYAKITGDGLNQFRFSFNEFGRLFMEHSRPLSDRERRLYTIFARQMEKSLMYAENVAERQQAEEELRSLNRELEHTVEERTRQLMAAQEELVRKEKLSILGQLSGRVGHELRNPLGVMSNAVYFLKMVLTEADETVQDYLGIIESEIGNSLRIITDLLDFARTRPPRTAEVTIRELTEKSLRRCAIPEDIDLQSEIPDNLPRLRVDPLQIEQVLINFLTNAVQAMPEGGALRVAAYLKSRESGSGNREAENLSNADFDVPNPESRFHRHQRHRQRRRHHPGEHEKTLPAALHHQSQGDRAGTGGLQKPGGGQWRANRSGERAGAGHNLYPVAADREEGKNMSDKLKILVVDDDRRMVRTICDILRLKGYEVLPAYSGEEAVEVVQGEEFDCVLMDIRMPGIDGVAALKTIKNLAPDTPVVLMSAYASDAQVAEAKGNGAASVLTKPIDFQQVLSYLSLLRKESSVLIVDDDLEFSQTLKEVLQSNGYRVNTEEDPAKVLSHMEQEYQLLVILDLKLGKDDGLEVLQKVRARYPEKPFVLVTGERHEMAASIAQGMQVGAYTCLYKPLAVDRLIGIIEDISTRKRNALLGEPFNGEGL